MVHQGLVHRLRLVHLLTRTTSAAGRSSAGGPEEEMMGQFELALPLERGCTFCHAVASAFGAPAEGAAAVPRSPRAVVHVALPGAGPLP